MEWSGELDVAIIIATVLGLSVYIWKYIRRIQVAAAEAKITNSKSSIEQGVLSVQTHAIAVEALVLSYLEQRQRDPVRYLDRALFLRDEEKDAVIKDLSRSRDILFHADRLLAVELNKIRMTDGELMDLNTTVHGYLAEISDIEKRIKDLLQTGNMQTALSKSL